MPEDDKNKIVVPPVDDKIVVPPVDDKDKKGLTQEEVDKVIADRLARADEKFKETLTTERKKWEDDAKLSDKEKRDKEEKEKEEARVNKENDISLRENRLNLVEKMSEAKVPASFADFIVSTNTEKTIENFNKFKTVWEKSLEEYVKGRISTDSIHLENQERKETVIKNGAVIRDNGTAIM